MSPGDQGILFLLQCYIFRLHRMHAMHEMQSIFADVRGVCASVGPSVSLSACLSRGWPRLYCAKTAERIKMLFGGNTLDGPRDINVTRGSWFPHRQWRKPTFKCWNPSYLQNGWSQRLEILRAYIYRVAQKLHISICLMLNWYSFVKPQPNFIIFGRLTHE